MYQVYRKVVFIMNISERFMSMGEAFAAGMYEETDRSLFYRKALGLRRYFENISLPQYKGEYLYPSGPRHETMMVGNYYWNGFNYNYGAMHAHDPELANMIANDFCRYHATVPMEHSVGAGPLYTHSFPHYERIIAEGFDSYEERIAKIEDEDMREGLLHLTSGIRTYVKRCVEYLESVSADQKLIDALKRVPMKPAENIYDAIVCWNFIFYLDCCDNVGCLASGLMPYYKGENVVEVLKNFYDNVDANTGYSMALGIDYSPLTIQCLEAVKGKRKPQIELFVNRDTPDEIWKKAFEVVRTNGGQPAFYNHDAIHCGLMKRFPSITETDIKKFCGGGCTETMLAGLSNVGSLDAGINLALILTQVINEKLEISESYEQFYSYFMEETRAVVDMVTREISNSQKNRAELNPLPMRTLLIDDCIDNGKDFNNGGARYMWSIINFAGMINVIDSMLVIRDLVFRQKRYSASELVGFLKANDEKFLEEAKNHPVSFGHDDEDADTVAHEISREIYSMLDDKMPYFGLGFIAASIQFNTAASAGAGVSATPDGRKSGAPLCDSIGPIFGKAVKGPTALLKSSTSLELKKALGTPVLNFTVNPNFDDEVLKGLILGYVELGGIQMQITCASREMLEEAYADPNKHRNLIVRVGGYSEYFCRLPDDLKRVVMERAVHLG